MKVRDPHFRLERIRKYIDEDIFPARIRDRMTLSDWRYIEHSMEERLDDAWEREYDESGFTDFHLPDTWGGYDKVAWFRCKAVLPESFRGKTVAFRGIVGPRDGGDSTAETLLYVNGKPVQGIDIWHEEAYLDPAIYENEGAITIALKAWSGVLGVPKVRVFREAALVVIEEAADRLYHMTDTLLKCMELLSESDLRRISMTKLLVAAFARVNFLNYREASFYDSVKEAADYLQEELANWYQIAEIKPTVTGVGHSHIDMGWLWRYSATREKASRTFSTVLNLMRQFPEYRYLHTSPQLYRFLEQDYPELFAEVKQKIKEGQWEITGGMWVEPDTNLPNGESLIRQFLFGKRYMKDTFDMESRLVWLPDVFGYSGALPQIMVKCDMDYFMTTKISWNQYNHFPYDTFWWKGIDGSRIFTHFITTPENGSWFYTYNGQMQPEEITGIWENYKDRDKNDELLIAFGWGDGGGGPTREMLTRAGVMKNVPGIPRVQIDTSERYFKRIYDNIDHENLGEWEGELYFEYHRGTYTSQAKIKRDNRKAEGMMHNLEFLHAWADILCGTDDYPKQIFHSMWEEILLNQFHDVLPGSSIRQVYEDTAAMYERLFAKGEELLAQGMKRIGRAVSKEAGGLLLVNTTGFDQRQVICLPWSETVTAHTGVWAGGKALLTQQTKEGMLVLAEEVPSYGCRLLSVREGNGTLPIQQEQTTLAVTDDTLENHYLRLVLHEDGTICSIYDKEADREIGCGEPMNQFRAYEDKPQRFDAWDIDVYYKEKPYPVPVLKKREIMERGPVEAVIRQTYSFASSTITQDIVLQKEGRRVDFRTAVNWNEKQVLLRVFFPVDVHASFATYEIQCGSIERPTHTNTEWEFAKFEVCAQKWVDLSEEGYGVSLLNDCKYGHDIHGNTIAMTLIKSAVRPDETADRCHHTFTYSIYPHTGRVTGSQVQKEAMSLNLPLLTAFTEGGAQEDLDGISLVSAKQDNLMIDTVKRAEDERAYIIRFYEYKNRKENAAVLTFGQPIRCAKETNLIERELAEIPFKNNKVEVPVTGYEIKTIKVSAGN